jgi:hypothetical protein
MLFGSALFRQRDVQGFRRGASVDEDRGGAADRWLHRLRHRAANRPLHHFGRHDVRFG